jgi:hypothetical protein
MIPGAIQWALGAEHRRDMLRTADHARVAAAGRKARIARRVLLERPSGSDQLVQPEHSARSVRGVERLGGESRYKLDAA